MAAVADWAYQRNARGQSPRTHVYALAFAYSVLSLVAVLVILVQSIDPTVLQTKAESSERAALSGSTAVSGSTNTAGVKTRRMCTDPHEPRSGHSAIKEEFELGSPASPRSVAPPATPTSARSPRPTHTPQASGTYSPPLSPSTPASVRLTRQEGSRGAVSEETHGSWERVGRGRKPVPEV